MLTDSSFLWTPEGPADKWLGTLTHEIFHYVNTVFRDPNNLTRVVRLENANGRYPGQPAILVRLAQDYCSLDDPIGAYLCAQRAHGLIEHTQRTDPPLATWVRFLHNTAQTHIHKQSNVFRICTAPL